MRKLITYLHMTIYSNTKKPPYRKEVKKKGHSPTGLLFFFALNSSSSDTGCSFCFLKKILKTILFPYNNLFENTKLFMYHLIVNGEHIPFNSRYLFNYFSFQEVIIIQRAASFSWRNGKQSSLCLWADLNITIT